MIAVKQELGILADRQGKFIRDYDIVVENDELVVTDANGELFEYKPNNKESQRIQETLFHEKQSIIENCLFGVDINPNSVKICRLRLWIELLKNAYYTKASFDSAQPALETLPNIDINIKCGNSLVSRFAIDSDLNQALKQSKWNIESYRMAVSTYRTAQNKEQKREMERLIADIKSDFRSNIDNPFKKRISVARGKVDKLATEINTQQQWGDKPSKQLTKDLETATAQLKKLEQEKDEIENNKIFENAFEWRFEFPEVLSENGDFVGFDVVIGNPPYIRQEEFSEMKPYLSQNFPETSTGTADLFVYFVELALKVLKVEGDFSFIVPNKWMRAGYGKKLREFIAKHQIHFLIDFGDLPVFEEATTYPNIIQLQKRDSSNEFNACNIDTLDFPTGLEDYLEKNKMKIQLDQLSSSGWTLNDSKIQNLLIKIKSCGTPLGDYVNKRIYRGVLTGLNEAFIIDKETRDRLICEDHKCDEIIKPFLAGRDIKRYQSPQADKYLIFARRGIDIELYPAVLKHLEKFQHQLEPKPKNHVGEWKGRKPGSYKWYEIQDAVDYYDEFDKYKVMLPDIALRCEALLDESNGFYSVNTAYIIPNLSKSDLGILNSRLTLFFYSNLTQSIRGGYLRFIRQYLEQIPMIKTDSLDKLVSEVIQAKKQSSTADTTALEAEIDRLVYELYGLTEEEVKIVEGREEDKKH